MQAQLKWAHPVHCRHHCMQLLVHMTMDLVVRCTLVHLKVLWGYPSCPRILSPFTLQPVFLVYISLSVLFKLAQTSCWGAVQYE